MQVDGLPLWLGLMTQHAKTVSFASHPDDRHITYTFDGDSFFNLKIFSRFEPEISIEVYPDDRTYYVSVWIGSVGDSLISIASEQGIVIDEDPYPFESYVEFGLRLQRLIELAKSIGAFNEAIEPSPPQD